MMIKKSQDAFAIDPLGEALKDYQSGKAKNNFINVWSSFGEEDHLWVKQFFRAFDEMPRVEQEALKKCEGKIIDVGAGGGAHSNYLMRLGLEVMPIDVSKGAVEVMISLGLLNARQVDFFDLDGKDKFDTILMLMNGSGIVGKVSRLVDFFNQAKILLNPGGQIIMDSSDILYMFEDEIGNFELDFSKNYYGEVEYKMKYKTLEGDKFPWLFIDYSLLKSHARVNGFNIELICKQSNHAYSCRLWKND